jgi:uncharacterized protein
MAALNQPLTDAEYDHVASMLARSDRAMNVEMLDGFFAALICGPDLVRPSEYLRVIWGGDKIGGDRGWRDEAEMQEFFDLIMRHWNSVIAALSSGEPFMPFLLEDEDGIARANDWAEGFARGMKLRTDGWTELFDDEKHAGLLVPILALAHERDPDPAMRPYKEPIDAERREQLIIGAAAGVTGIYRYFAARRRRSVLSRQEVATPQRPKGKVGRNEPCPCGSGKKFKKCCGAVTLH